MRGRQAGSVALFVLLAVAGCSSRERGYVTPTGSPTGTGSPEGGAPSPGAPVLGSPDGGACPTPPPPAGTACTCWYTNCEATALRCDCDPGCYESRTDCLIVVDPTGAPQSSDPLLSTCTLTCSFVQGTNGELGTPSQVVCDATDCRAATPPPIVAPPTTPPPPVVSSMCNVPVPGDVILPGPVWGETNVQFHVPFPAWAFAAAHASYQMAALAGGESALHETPSFYFATSLKESFMGCSDKLPPYDAFNPGRIVQRTMSYADGCFQIDSGTGWPELCELYPETIDCAAVTFAGAISASNQDALGRDNFVSSAFAKAYYDAFSFALLTLHSMPSPDAWFAAAKDPLAMPKVMALLYNEGAWTGDATLVEMGCQSMPIESCLGNKDYVVSVSTYEAQLESAVAAGNCFNELVAVGDVDTYVAQLVVLFTHEDAAALTAAGRAAFLATTGGVPNASFQAVAGPVLRAIDGAMTARVHCPGTELGALYKLGCPP